MYMLSFSGIYQTRAHKNRRLEQERVTPIEACSPGKIIELLLKIKHPVMCLAIMSYDYAQLRSTCYYF